MMWILKFLVSFTFSGGYTTYYLIHNQCTKRMVRAIRLDYLSPARTSEYHNSRAEHKSNQKS